jgi:hypothetical protein
MRGYLIGNWSRTCPSSHQGLEVNFIPWRIDEHKPCHVSDRGSYKSGVVWMSPEGSCEQFSPHLACEVDPERHQRRSQGLASIHLQLAHTPDASQIVRRTTIMPKLIFRPTTP